MDKVGCLEIGEILQNRCRRFDTDRLYQLAGGNKVARIRYQKGIQPLQRGNIANSMAYGNIAIKDIALQLREDVAVACLEILGEAAFFQIGLKRATAALLFFEGQKFTVGKGKQLLRDMSAGQLCPQLTAQQGCVGTRDDHLILFIKLLPYIELPFFSRLDLIEKKEPRARFRNDCIEQRIIGDRKAREAQVIKIEIKVIPTPLSGELVQQRALAAPANTRDYQRMRLHIRQRCERLPLKPGIERFGLLFLARRNIAKLR